MALNGESLTTTVGVSTAGSDAADRAVDTHIRYRADVDGLRSLAALAVVAAHSFFPSLQGGASGVDMFFVLSGFLISGILLRGLLQDRLSFSDFYARRVKRIFPALIVVLSAVWLVGSVLLLPGEYERLGKDIATSAVFSQYIFWRLEHSSALVIDYGGMMLNHLWSLGVEEQFYLLWPLFLVTIWKVSRRRIQHIAAAMAAVMLVSLALLLVGDHRLPPIALVVCRGLWGLCAGSLLACVQMGGMPKTAFIPRSFPSRHLFAIAAVVLLYVGIAGNPDQLFTRVVAPVVGTVLLILSGPQSFVNERFFSSPPMVLIGKISYPLYLWHFPMLLFAHAVTWNSRPGAAVMFAIVSVSSLVLAFLTYKFVELPIRFGSSKTAVVRLLGLMAVCAVIGTATFVGAIRPLSYSRADDFVLATTEDWLQGPGADSWTMHQEGGLSLGHGSRHALFLGDSNMQQYYPRIEKLVSDNLPVARSAVFYTRSGCAPGIVEMLSADEQEQSACRAHLNEALAHANDSHVDVVVVAAAWYASLVEVQDFRSIGQRATLKPNVDRAMEELAKTLGTLRRNGKQVYLVLNLPVGARLDPRAHVYTTRLLAAQDSVGDTNKDTIVAALQPITSRLRDVARATGARTIDPLSTLCGTSDCSATTEYGTAKYRDLWHLRPSYVRDHVKYLDAIILEP